MQIDASAQWSAPKLHIIVTCTERKKVAVPEELRLRNIAGGDSRTRARAWVRQLEADGSAPAVRARELYAGEHWSIAVTLPALIDNVDAQLWTCSAGYGLISADTLIRPYAATLAPGHLDSVHGGSVGAVTWWHALASWVGPEPGQPRSIRELAALTPDAHFLLVLSAPYLQACRDDIAAAAESVTDHDHIMLVSSGTRNAGPIADLLLPADARLQTWYGGTRQVLNMRIAADLLANQLLSRKTASSYLASVLSGQPPIRRYDRKKLDDQEVLSWIRAAQESMPGASASRMLRVLRDSGYACEQHRFGELHRRFAENLT